MCPWSHNHGPSSTIGTRTSKLESLVSIYHVRLEQHTSFLKIHIYIDLQSQKSAWNSATQHIGATDTSRGICRNSTVRSRFEGNKICGCKVLQSLANFATYRGTAAMGLTCVDNCSSLVTSQTHISWICVAWRSDSIICHLLGLSLVMSCMPHLTSELTSTSKHFWMSGYTSGMDLPLTAGS